MDSTTQETTPVVETSESAEQPSTNLVEINGEKLTLDELKSGYMRQQDYTRKTQELSKEKKVKTAEEENLSRWIADEGYVTKDQLEALSKQTEQELSFAELLRNNPELKKQETIIRKLAKADGIAFEDAISKYNLTSVDKLKKAKESGPIVGTTDRGERPSKSIDDMTPAEYEKRKDANADRFSGGKFKKDRAI